QRWLLYAHSLCFLKCSTLHLDSPASSSTSTLSPMPSPVLSLLTATCSPIGRDTAPPSQCRAAAGSGCHQSPVRACHRPLHSSHSRDVARLYAKRSSSPVNAPVLPKSTTPPCRWLWLCRPKSESWSGSYLAVADRVS